MGCSSLSPCLRPIDQQGALCHPSLPQTLDSLHRLKLAFDCCQSNVLFCSTCLLYDQTDTRINIGAHGSQRNISRLLTNDFQRIKMLMGVFFFFFIWEPSVSDPYLGNYIRNSAWPILSSSISCPHKCQAPSVCYSSTLTMSFFSTPPSLYQLFLNVISSCTRLH